jgi:hypothetical protein
MLLVLITNSAGRGSRAGDKHRQTGQTQTDDEIVTVDMMVGAQTAKGASSEHKWHKHRKLYMMHKNG